MKLSENFKKICAIRLCFRLQNSKTYECKASDSIRRLFLSMARVSKCFKVFSEGRESIDDTGIGRPAVAISHHLVPYERHNDRRCVKFQSHHHSSDWDEENMYQNLVLRKQNLFFCSFSFPLQFTTLFYSQYWKPISKYVILGHEKLKRP